MINSMQKAIIMKDFKSVAANKNLMPALIIVPSVFTVIFPLIFILIIYFVPDQMDDFESMVEMLPEQLRSNNMNEMVIALLLDFIMPMFFMMIPIITSSIMSASSFIGEKEKRTLETLLYSPLSLTQIFQSKVWASFMLSMLVTLASFALMLITMETGAFLILGTLILPGISWIFILFLVAPAISLLAIVLIVRGSAKSKTIEESQQRSLYLIMPVILLVISQFTGIILINAWFLLVTGAVLGLLAWFMMKKSMNKFTYELLLKR